MGSSEAGNAFVLLDREIRRHGMSRDTYRRIADAFQSPCTSVSPELLLSVLEHFVRFQDDLLYVNEIRNFLRESSPSLFREYGHRFVRCRGCLEVFGIEPVGVVDHDFKVGRMEEREKTKEYGKRRRRAKNSIKRQARARAALSFKKRLDEKRERRRKSEEINEMIRRQNI